ncbi:hypothetical protein CPB83DRAFT_900179 [Crepidotus variabilis]|uniref:Uncharacterized protein n=1 Tax=Crepidotus variabilis TaxID=179855 RepID=A0A9P6E3J1_9AGAR|nr:hypothetical protein CPB83DRAFT_900179 [Crepidotus variabilis]
MLPSEEFETTSVRAKATRATVYLPAVDDSSFLSKKNFANRVVFPIFQSEVSLVAGGPCPADLEKRIRLHNFGLLDDALCSELSVWVELAGISRSFARASISGNAHQPMIKALHQQVLSSKDNDLTEFVLAQAGTFIFQLLRAPETGLGTMQVFAKLVEKSTFGELLTRALVRFTASPNPSTDAAQIWLAILGLVINTAECYIKFGSYLEATPTELHDIRTFVELMHFQTRKGLAADLERNASASQKCLDKWEKLVDVVGSNVQTIRERYKLQPSLRVLDARQFTTVTSHDKSYWATHKPNCDPTMFACVGPLQSLYDTLEENDLWVLIYRLESYRVIIQILLQTLF